MEKTFELAGNHTDANLLILFSKDIVEQETGERGYLITGKENFLEPYYEGIANFNTHVSLLKSHVFNSPNASGVNELIEHFLSLSKK